MDDRAVGFAVGHDTVAREEWLRHVMTATRGTPVHDWLPDAWYLADIAVLPEMQGRGVGRQMHDVLMDLTVDRRRMLVTYHGDHPAKRFYRRLGWVELVPDLEYVPGAPLTSLMVYIGRKP
jgi:GNAT superfamily N-acetyltransferase